MSDNYNITVTPKRKDDTLKHRRASNTCKLAVREVYKALARTDQSFGFELGRDKSYKDEINRRMTDRLVNAVIASEGGMEKSSWPLREIEGACKTYYISLRDTERRKLSGKEKEHTQRSRRQSRRRERAARLKKTLKSVGEDKLGEFDKERVIKVFTGDYMSSEESEEDEAGEFSHFSVRRLPWQKEAFQTLKDRLEEIHKESLTPQHKRQLKKRKLSTTSSRRKAPEGCPKFVRRDEDAE